jgi:ABC-type Fe3+-hydroxamate transport system substrate-binding protein
MMAMAGLENVFAGRQRYPEISMEELEQSGCSLVLLSSEPYPFKQKHIDELASRLPGIRVLPANGEMFSWYGSRLLQVPAYLQQLRKLTGQAK